MKNNNSIKKQTKIDVIIQNEVLKIRHALQHKRLKKQTFVHIFVQTYVSISVVSVWSVCVCVCKTGI